MPTPNGGPVASASVASTEHLVLRPATLRLTRWLIYAALASSALFFLVPLVVVIDKKGMIRAQSPPQGDPNLQDETKLRVMVETLLKEPSAVTKRTSK